MKKRKSNPEFDRDSLRKYMALPAEQKLDYLERMNQMLDALMPPQSKKIWQELKNRGW